MAQLTYIVNIIALVSILAGNGEPYKILIAPYFSGFNSRLLNMQKMADMLARDSHQVDVIMNNKVKDHVIAKHAGVISFTVPGDAEGVTGLSIEDLNMSGLSFFAALDKMIEMQVSFCEGLFGDDVIMDSIRNRGYDLIIGDVFSLCTAPLSSHLNITTIFYQNYGFFCESTSFYPIFPSFTCHAPGTFCNSDDMTFLERVLNTVFVVLQNYYLIPAFIPTLEKIAQNTGIDLKIPMERIYEEKIILINADYVLDTPRPTMPHVFMTSGLFHKKPAPLSDEYQRIIDASYPQGVVLMSFGTLVPKFDSKTAEKFAKVLGQLKQQVIWRYTGERPKGLKNNTHLTEWFPQNDLLANPATMLFITHCGISSTFESAYNGVPVVAMPLFVDQTYNAKKLTDRARMGILLDYYTVTEGEFKAGIDEVLTNPMYENNAKLTSLTISDQLVPPIQKFRHLVNFTIKTGGAKHLFHPYATRMSWFTYSSLDVLSFLLLIMIFVFSILFLSLWKFYQCCCASKKVTKVKRQ